MPTFQPPTVNDNPAVLPETSGLALRLFRYFGPYTRGRSVLKIAGVYSTWDYPSDLDIAAASEVYLGGHVYIVTDSVAAALTAAGYGAYIL